MRRRASRRAGFTLIEVIVSLGVMMVGAMAVIGLQAHAIRGNAHASRITIATQIAQRWIERLKQDAHSWTVVGTDSGTIAGAFANTTYLGANLAALTGSPDAFRTLTTNFAGTGISNAFDARGRDTLANGSQAFCASYRQAWIWEGQLMRVDVRVWWPREQLVQAPVPGPNGQTPSVSSRHVLSTDFAGCADDGVRLNPGGGLFDWYHMVYLSTAIRVNEVRR